MGEISTIGIDLGKRLFHVVGLDARGAVVLERRCGRSGLMRLLGRLGACRVGLEACATSHYWGRRLGALGHEVVLLPAQYVKPYRRGQKNDLRDAAAIAEAATRVGIPAVAVKTEAEQLLATRVRVRAGQVQARTALANRLRAHLAEFGLVVPRGLARLRRRLGELFGAQGRVVAEAEGVPGELIELLRPLWEALVRLDAHIAALDAALARRLREDERLRRLATVPGFGPVTAAAFAAAVGDVRRFRRGRMVAAWLGLVPRQHTTGGRVRLGRISKHGNAYVRACLVHAARALWHRRQRLGGPLGAWLRRLAARVHPNVAVVALAARLARIGWAVLASGRDFEPAGAAA